MKGTRSLAGGSGVMRDHDHGLADVTAERAQDLEHGLGRVGVKISGRFIGDDQIRIGNNCAGNSDTLFLSAGQLLR